MRWLSPPLRRRVAAVAPQAAVTPPRAHYGQLKRSHPTTIPVADAGTCRSDGMGKERGGGGIRMVSRPQRPPRPSAPPPLAFASLSLPQPPPALRCPPPTSTTTPSLLVPPEASLSPAPPRLPRPPMPPPQPAAPSMKVIGGDPPVEARARDTIPPFCHHHGCASPRHLPPTAGSAGRPCWEPAASTGT